MPRPTHLSEALARSRPLALALGALFVLLIAATAWQLGPAPAARPSGTLLDFDVFRLAGQLAWREEMPQAYDGAAFRPLQQEAFGRDIFLPWTYPPHYNLLVAPLALLPAWAGYGLFSTGSLVLFLVQIRRLAGARFLLVTLMLTPAILVCLKTGQNGLFFGGLLALFVNLRGAPSARRRLWAGPVLALLAAKPHFFLGLLVYLLWRREWRLLGLAAVTLALMLGLATLAFGPAIWPAFREGAAQSGSFMALGVYPFFRMVSVFAGLASMAGPGDWGAAGGGTADWALALHLAVALLLVAGLFYSRARGADPRVGLALALGAGFLISPYAYDYDVPIFGVTLALLLPLCAGRIGDGTARMLILLGWLTALPSLVMALVLAGQGGSLAGAGALWSLGWLGVTGSLTLAALRTAPSEALRLQPTQG
ncbi:glycosyltransferase family 87 protein [Maritimibacter alkaliphilus]|uniref:glycosyltransferase family 87 protein n=1 Tax=Maritimibacter alkaliphilus TaxID=404236 RepID=UPI001C98CCC7|nr:glycosyltransferase family 87 protein [Maritimibacter alkaliphilus]MBY6089393.1 DUF2029 domain-containing protein [Maritimibacter alkaliphilus]